MAYATATAPLSRRMRRLTPSTYSILSTMLLSVILLQRFSFDVGGEPLGLTLAICYAGLILLLLREDVREDVRRLWLYLAAAALCGVAVILNEAGSTNSYLLLLVMFLPWVFRLRTVSRVDHDRLLGLFVTTMVLLATVGVGQMVAQVTHAWRYQDVIAAYVPAEWLQRAYNTNIPMQWGSPIHKAQAFVFLEPSFFSQFCALAFIIGLLLRRPAWQLVLLLLGLIASLSGTGILLLVVGLVVLVVRERGWIRPSLIVVALLALAALLFTSAGETLAERRQETQQSRSSLSLRFVHPYQQAWEGLEAEPRRYLVGAGPGMSERVLESHRDGGGLAVVYTIVPKAIFEYGLIAGSALVGFLLFALTGRTSRRVVPACLLLLLFVLSGSLLQPHTVIVAWLLSIIWAAVPEMPAVTAAVPTTPRRLPAPVG